MSKAEDNRAQAHRILLRESVAAVLRKSITESMPPGTELNEADTEAFTQISLMCVATTGEEDPVAILSGASDQFLRTVLLKTGDAQGNQAARTLCSLALLEWCKRQGHLEGGWTWRWEGRTKGHATYMAKTPIEDVLNGLLKES